mmetsp:Transcript_28647/g.93591  ORF Transcript_28647/g.93591 Transcript_28647/m.93591 type:complete len:263 (+) Transcript_28647:436-1224(+)
MARSVTVATSRSKVGRESARTVPASLAVSGMTLKTLPASKMVTETTPESVGSAEREMTVWSAATTAAPATIGSRVWCGAAPCPPAPTTRMSNEPAAAIAVPARTPMRPGVQMSFTSPQRGATCSPNAAPADPSAPSSSIRSAPAPPSSAGWKMSRTSPGSSASCALSIRAAPSSIVMCASCPHACILPEFVEWKSTSVLSSWTGNASMSARSATEGPPFFAPIVATTPVSATGNSYETPSASSSRLISAEVLNSSKRSSGMR